MMGFSCQPIQKSDMGRIVEIEAACFAEPWNRAMLEGEFLHEHSRALLLRMAGGSQSEIIGYFFFHLVTDEMHVLKIAIAPKYRRCGGARQLMMAGMSAAVKQDAAMAFLEVRRSNAAAFLFYKNLGFERVGIRPAYYKNPGTEDAIIMQKTLQGGNHGFKDRD